MSPSHPTTQQSTSGPKKYFCPINELGMEGRIPTMPDMYNRNFRILRTYHSNQDSISQAQYIPSRSVACPQCLSSSLALYDHYSRKANFINKDGVRRTLIIRATRYRCQHCSYLFREPIEGLQPKKRSSEQFGSTPKSVGRRF